MQGKVDQQAELNIKHLSTRQKNRKLLLFNIIAVGNQQRDTPPPPSFNVWN